MSVAQLSKLLPLPDEDLQQVLDYASTLSKQAAADHFNNLLGESPQSIEFISLYNSRRSDPTTNTKASQTQTQSQGVPKPARKQPKKKAALGTPAPRQVDNSYAGTVYKKQSEDDYISKRPTPQTANNASSQLTTKPAAVQAPIPKPPPSAAGSLISDFKSKSKSASSSRVPSQNTSRTSSPAPKNLMKVAITGGTSMHGASNVLSELDAAIRSLEISTNSTLLLPASQRACNCIATRHPLLASAPNCLNCGKVICVKEGLGPCTFCGTPLLSAVEVQSMIRSLREERGNEKMTMDNASHRRAEVAKKPAPFSGPRPGQENNGTMTEAERKAKEHRDRLLGFQAQNAKRTTVRDEAVDFDTGIGGRGEGGNMWASPAERARQVKRQQKIFAEQEWNAKPEYEKRRQVVSVDLVNGKVIKRMAAVEKPSFEVEQENGEVEDPAPLSEVSGNDGRSRGTFSRNPLLGGLVKPVWSSGKDNDVELEGRKKKTWRRVQDSWEDNEEIILDGGAYGGTADRQEVEEPGCG